METDKFGSNFTLSINIVQSTFEFPGLSLAAEAQRRQDQKPISKIVVMY